MTNTCKKLTSILPEPVFSHTNQEHAMSSFTRRLFFGFATAIPAVGATALIETATETVAEDQTLLVLGEQIDPLLTVYRAAVARYTKMRATAEANCPVVPDEIVMKGPQWAGCTEREQDVDGEDVWSPDYIESDGKTYARPPRNLLNSVKTKAAIKRGNLYFDGRTRFGKQMRKLIDVAERYEAEREATIEASGIRQAAQDRYLAATDIERVAYRVREFKPRTMAGIITQARALSAHAEAELDAHGFEGRSGTVLGRELAAAILRVMPRLEGAA